MLFNDSTITIWDAYSGVELISCYGHSSFVNSVSFNCDGTRFASGSDDKKIIIWDASSGAVISTLLGHERDVYSVCYNMDSSKLASGVI